jgi:hypothetical protein
LYSEGIEFQKNSEQDENDEELFILGRKDSLFIDTNYEDDGEK